MPRILVTQAARMLRGLDGHVYAPTSSVDDRFWKRYLAVFDEVGVACRVQASDVVPADWPRADGEKVRFHDLPCFVGPWAYLAERKAVRRALREIVEQYDAVCLRVPCWIGTLAYRELRSAGRPFGLEVVGDPWDSLAPGTVRSATRPLARFLAWRALRRQCRDAAAAAYVTTAALQRRYPPGSGAYTTHYSSVELNDDAFVAVARSDFSKAHRLIFVGTLEVLYKAPDVLLRALAQCQRRDVQLTIVGDGRRRGELEALAQRLAVRRRVRFAGALAAGGAVRAALDEADLFVLPSRQEGLPRAMLEAMARGLPCIGSTAGGMGELLPPEALVGPGDDKGLARLIEAFLADRGRMAAAAARNLATARAYHREVLAVRRKSFYEALRDASQGGQ